MSAKSSVWEDLVNDYLEVSADLQESERKFLIDHLKQKNVAASNIASYPSFQVADQLIVICKEPYQECWFYNPSKKKIGRQRKFNS